MPPQLLKRKPSLSSPGDKLKSAPTPPPPPTIPAVPVTPPPVLDTKIELEKLKERFTAEAEAKETKALRASGRHAADCQCERCVKNRLKKAGALATTTEADRIAEELLDKRIRAMNNGLMKFVAELLKSDPPSGIEIELTEQGAVDIVRRMSPTVLDKFTLIAFLSGWAIFLTPRVMQFVQDRSKQPEPAA